MATKKKTTKKDTEKRPARQFYTTYLPLTGGQTGTYPTKARAERDKTSDEKVAGPYVLAERTGNR